MAASKASSVGREKRRRTRVVAVRMTVDCRSPAAPAAVGEWGGAEPSSCTSVTPRASPVRRIVSMVRAKDPDGAPIMVVLSPDSITVLTEATSGEEDGMPSDPTPSAATPPHDRCVAPNPELVDSE
jgi:hypothetical protein